MTQAAVDRIFQHANQLCRRRGPDPGATALEPFISSGIASVRRARALDIATIAAFSSVRARERSPNGT